MSVIAITQVAGGVGATTLATNLTNVWPAHSRILMELGVTGGSLIQIMGFDSRSCVIPPTLTDLVTNGYEFGSEGNTPASLSYGDMEEWELPVVPGPVVPDFPRPGEPAWWQRRVDLAVESNLDVIVDMGRVAPEHMIIHNRILNSAAVILVVVRNVSEARTAVSRLTLYQDRLAIAVISRLRSSPQEISEQLDGRECAEVLRFEDDIADHLWRGTLVTESKIKKPRKEYLDAVNQLAAYLQRAKPNV